MPRNSFSLFPSPLIWSLAAIFLDHSSDFWAVQYPHAISPSCWVCVYVKTIIPILHCNIPSTFSGLWQCFLSCCAKADSYLYTWVTRIDLKLFWNCGVIQGHFRLNLWYIRIFNHSDYFPAHQVTPDDSKSSRKVYLQEIKVEDNSETFCPLCCTGHQTGWQK